MSEPCACHACFVSQKPEGCSWREESRATIADLQARLETAERERDAARNWRTLRGSQLFRSLRHNVSVLNQRHADAIASWCSETTARRMQQSRAQQAEAERDAAITRADTAERERDALAEEQSARTYGLAHDPVTPWKKVRAERDAALAKLARVRELADTYNTGRGATLLMSDLLAVLDGDDA